MPNIGTSIKDTIIAAHATWKNRPFIWTLENGHYNATTYGEVIGVAFALAQELLQAGVTGQRVAVFAKNSPAWVSVDYALALSANIAVPIDASWRLTEAKNALLFIEPSIVFYDSSTTTTIQCLRRQLPHTSFRAMSTLPKHLDAAPDFPDRAPGDVAKIFFSSGTTAAPKAIMLSESNMLYGWREIEKRLAGVGEQDRCYVFIPFHHVYGNEIILLYALPIGCQLYLAHDLKQAKTEMQLARPTIIHGVPLFYERIYRAIPPAKLVIATRLSNIMRTLHMPYFFRKRLFRDLHGALGERARHLISGGARLDPLLHAFFDGCGLPIYNAYGATETSGPIAVTPRHTRRYGSVGSPYEGVTVTIVDQDESGSGEIVVNGPTIFKGYYNNQEATSACLDTSGSYRTGDRGHVDTSNILWVTGRKRRLILLSNGENVWPDELETLLQSLPHVTKATVYEKSGEICATIVVDSSRYISSTRQETDALNHTLSKHTQLKHVSIAASRPHSFQKS